MLLAIKIKHGLYKGVLMFTNYVLIMMWRTTIGRQYYAYDVCPANGTIRIVTDWIWLRLKSILSTQETTNAKVIVNIWASAPVIPHIRYQLYSSTRQ